MTGDVTVDTLVIGNTPLTIDGNLEFTLDSTLAIAVSSSTNFSVTVTGGVTLDGTLSLTLMNASITEVPVLSAGNVTGEFARVSISVPTAECEPTFETDLRGGTSVRVIFERVSLPLSLSLTLY